eukprot:TRINITY_DN33449_c0_g1_i1.p1 TRINITY_DN33449_c0_g1~~TRINITY_DN33449_c0_g1_i1.p1  ORF type:complete len:368 (+),score=107.37 TRINITY_DN33449_c0_g1_i1:57-1160(+)
MDDTTGRYKRKKVLSEEEYEEQLKGIIIRDYFPGLAELRKEEKALEERNVLDIEKRILGCGEDEEEKAEEVAVPNMSIGEFLNKNVSEENVSFDMLVENDKEEHKRRWAWCYKDGINTSALINGPTQGVKLLADGSNASATTKLLEAHDIRIESKPQGLLITTARAGKPAGTSTKAGPPPTINKTASRFNQEPPIKKQKKNPAPLEYRIGDERGLISTPVIEPGASPFMTWGALDATPLVLDKDKDEVAPHAGLVLPDVREREIQGTKLMQQVKKKKETRSQNTPLKDKLLASVGMTPRPNTPSAVIAALTPSRTDIFSKGNAYKATPRRPTSSRPNTAPPTPIATPKRTPLHKKKPSSITDNLMEI